MGNKCLEDEMQRRADTLISVIRYCLDVSIIDAELQEDEDFREDIMAHVKSWGSIVSLIRP